MLNMEKKINKQLCTLSEILYELRTKQLNKDGKPWTQRDVASKLGITYQSYQAYELGKAVPTIQNFLKIAEIYDVSLDYLVGKKEY
ncbi:MAG: helix-turn-helix transcriptional regulator [Clostridiales bacterium]|nr:helix-turn-helix transcriptional regulator [Clostridiales bacterium]